MKKLLLINFFLFFSLTNIILAETNINYIDMDKVISTSKPGSSIRLQLTELNDKNLKYIKNEEKKLKDKEKKIITQKNLLSEGEFQSKIDELKLEIISYNKNKNKIIKNFNQLKIDNTNKLLQLITPILTKYADKKSISMILLKKNLIIGKTELDITEEIIIIVNKEIDEFKIK
jgi:outer membrane protein